MLNELRTRLSYANVVASIALFVAIGGTSYAAITLPRDSVGTKQIRRGAVGQAEIKRNAVTSGLLRDGSIRPNDLSLATRAALAGAPGPAGPPGPAGLQLRTSVSSAGATSNGNADSSQPQPPNKRIIGFARDLTGCTPVASLARLENGPVVDPGAGYVVVAIEGGKVAVQTYNATGNPQYLPFNLIVAC